MTAQTGLGTSPGVPPSVGSVTAQITTQVNPAPGVGVLGGLSNVQAEQQLAVSGPLYLSPGGINNKAGGNITTGGGP